MSQRVKDIIICLVLSTIVISGLILFKFESGKQEQIGKIAPIRVFSSGPDAPTYYVIDEIEIDGQTYLVLVDAGNMAKCIIPKAKSPK